MSSKTVAKILKAEGWYGRKTVYYIEFRVRRLRRKRHPENVQTEDQIVHPCLLDHLVHRRTIDPELARLSFTENDIGAIGGAEGECGKG